MSDYDQASLNRRATQACTIDTVRVPKYVGKNKQAHRMATLFILSCFYCFSTSTTHGAKGKHDGDALLSQRHQNFLLALLSVVKGEPNDVCLWLRALGYFLLFVHVDRFRTYPVESTFYAREMQSLTLYDTAYSTKLRHIGLTAAAPYASGETSPLILKRRIHVHAALSLLCRSTRERFHACLAAALISSAPSKLDPCNLPNAPATHASATLSLDTGGDKATCRNPTSPSHDSSV